VPTDNWYEAETTGDCEIKKDEAQFLHFDPTKPLKCPMSTSSIAKELDYKKSNKDGGCMKGGILKIPGHVSG